MFRKPKRKEEQPVKQSAVPVVTQAPQLPQRRAEKAVEQGPTAHSASPWPQAVRQPRTNQNVVASGNAPPFTSTNVQRAKPTLHVQDSVGLARLQQHIDTAVSFIDHGEDPSLGNSRFGETLLESTSRAIAQDIPRQLNGPRNILATTYFSKVWAYSNSRLPPHLPPFRVYIPTYALLCLAARYSLSAYSNTNPSPAATGPCTTATIHVPSSLRLGTKAMVLALAPCESSTTPTLVIAIRGSATFADWAINFRPAPTSPAGFLDDAGNLVHSGFLHVARSTVAPMAQQLQNFLISQIDAGKWRDQGQLLLTGHSAGGAVASLLFCHMLSQSGEVNSPLKQLRASFKRVHCITYGVPPLTLLPLERPAMTGAGKEAQSRWRRNLFFSFLNEGDPVVRADPGYIRNLLELYSAPVPAPAAAAGQRPIWPVTANTLSNAGRLVVLRPAMADAQKKRRFLGLSRQEDKQEEKIEAVMTSDEQLRGIVYGDPMLHSMRLYKERIDLLAVGAVTGG